MLYVRDEVQALREPPCRREASNHHELLRSKAAVVNVMAKRRGVDHVRYG